MPTGYTVDEDKKHRIVEAHLKHKVPVSELAKGYGVNRKTIYKWLKEAEGKDNTMANQPTQPTEEEKAAQQPADQAPADQAPVDKAPAGESTPTDAPETVLADAKAKAEEVLAAAKDEAAKLVEEAKAEAEKVKADVEAEVEKLRGERRTGAEEATPAPAEEVECPNPSCDAKFSGDECPSCGFKHSAMVDPFATK